MPKKEIRRMERLGLPKYYKAIEKLPEDTAPTVRGLISFSPYKDPTIYLKPHRQARNTFRHELGHAADARIHQTLNPGAWRTHETRSYGPNGKRISEFASRSQEQPLPINSYSQFFGKTPEQTGYQYTPTNRWYTVGPAGFQSHSLQEAEEQGLFRADSRFAMPTRSEVAKRVPKDKLDKTMKRHRAYQTLTPAQQTLALRGGWDPEFSNPYRGQELTQAAHQWEQSGRSMQAMQKSIQKQLAPYASGSVVSPRGPIAPNQAVADLLNTYAVTPGFDPAKNTYDRMSYAQMADLDGRLRAAEERRLSYMPGTPGYTGAQPGSTAWYRQQEYLRSLENKDGTVRPFDYEHYASLDPVDPITQQALQGNAFARTILSQPKPSRPRPSDLPRSIQLPEEPTSKSPEGYTQTRTFANGSRVTYRTPTPLPPSAQKAVPKPTPQPATVQQPVKPDTPLTQRPQTPAARQTQPPAAQQTQPPAARPRLFPRRRLFRRWR